MNNKLLFKAFRKLGWGFVLIFLDFRMLYFDILPDVVGYIMIASALHYMGSLQLEFSKSKGVAYALILLSIPGVFIQSQEAFTQFSSVPLQLQIYSQGLLALQLLLVYQIFNGLAVMAQQAALKELMDIVITRRNLYMTVYLAELLFYPFLLNFDASWIILLLFIVGLMFIMEFLFIRLPFRFSRIETPISVE